MALSHSIFNIEYPVLAGFYADRSFVSSIAGAIGSGKTTVAIAKCFAIGTEQPPNGDGWRYIKVGVVRDTYPNLWKSTIPTFKKNIDITAKNVVFKGSQDRQASLTVHTKLSDGTFLEVAFEFMALGDREVDDLLGGYEATIIWLDETADLTPDAVDFSKGRVGRYPSGLMGRCAFSCILMTFNKKDVDHWIYKYCVEERAENHTFFDQPGGVVRAGANESGAYMAGGKWWKYNASAENAKNLTPTAESYYKNAVLGSDLSTIMRMHANDWAMSKDGTPVFPEYDDSLHFNRDIKAIDNVPIYIGADAGFTPACVILQQDGFGRVAVVGELTMRGTETMSGTQFGETLKQLIAQNFPSNRVAGFFTDPAGSARGHDSDCATWQDYVRRASGFPVRSAPIPDNNIHDRLEVVRLSLTTLIDGKPLLVLGSACPDLRRGFIKGYHYKTIKNAGADMSETTPNKYSPSSHIHDALQYGLLGMGLTGKNPKGRAKPQTVVVGSDWGVL